MSERVQLLLSDRILGMTLVPEGKVWNYGVGLTQLWSPNLGYAMTLDTPLLFWAEQHRPTAFLTVCCITHIDRENESDLDPNSLLTWRQETTAPMWRIVSLNFLSFCRIAIRSCFVMMYH